MEVHACNQRSLKAEQDDGKFKTSHKPVLLVRTT